MERSLLLAQLVGFLTLLRSVAFDRWITVVASALLVTGAIAALRGRTWGLALSLASAAAFPVAWAIGIAPFWFVWVGAIGALPFILASHALKRFDRQATTLLAALAVSAGGLTAVAWKYFAWDLFAMFPFLWPSWAPNHGLAVLALLGAGVAGGVAQHRHLRRERVRVAPVEPRARIAPVARDRGPTVELPEDEIEDAPLAARRRL